MIIIDFLKHMIVLKIEIIHILLDSVDWLLKSHPYPLFPCPHSLKPPEIAYAEQGLYSENSDSNRFPGVEIQCHLNSLYHSHAPVPATASTALFSFSVELFPRLFWSMKGKYLLGAFWTQTSPRFTKYLERTERGWPSFGSGACLWTNQLWPGVQGHIA